MELWHLALVGTVIETIVWNVAAAWAYRMHATLVVVLALRDGPLAPAVPPEHVEQEAEDDGHGGGPLC